MTIYQEAVFTAQRIDDPERNVENFRRWNKRWAAAWLRGEID